MAKSTNFIPLNRGGKITGEFICGISKEEHDKFLEHMIDQFTRHLINTYEHGYKNDLPLNLTLTFEFHR